MKCKEQIQAKKIFKICIAIMKVIQVSNLIKMISKFKEVKSWILKINKWI